MLRSGPAGEGESGTDIDIDIEGTRMIGEAEYPVDFPGPLRPEDTRAAPHDFVGLLQPGVARSSSFHPAITVVTPGNRTSDCSGYTYKVKWGIPPSEATSSGWIIQKVNKTFAASDCSGRPVAPVPFDDPAGYPFWEAWEFTAGQNVGSVRQPAGARTRATALANPTMDREPKARRPSPPRSKPS